MSRIEAGGCLSTAIDMCLYYLYLHLIVRRLLGISYVPDHLSHTRTIATSERRCSDDAETSAGY
jgi:hypothetical protein